MKGYVSNVIVNERIWNVRGIGGFEMEGEKMEVLDLGQFKAAYVNGGYQSDSIILSGPTQTIELSVADFERIGQWATKTQRRYS